MSRLRRRHPDWRSAKDRPGSFAAATLQTTLDGPARTGMDLDRFGSGIYNAPQIVVKKMPADDAATETRPAQEVQRADGALPEGASPGSRAARQRSSTRAGKPIPTAAAALGTRLVAVIPGIVFISKQ